MPRDLPVPGRELKGVHFAMEYLTQSNKRVEGDPIPEGYSGWLLFLDEFTSALLRRRRQDGFIDFQFPEPKVELDEGLEPSEA